MCFNLKILENENNEQFMRIGGGALTGGIIDRPLSPEGRMLTLIMSLPVSQLNIFFKTNLPNDYFISVFSYYDTDDYFLENIVYHGDQAELNHIRKGYTRVLIHPRGKLVSIDEDVDSYSIVFDSINKEQDNTYSKCGGSPKLIQNEGIDTSDLSFCLQFCGNLIKKPDDLLYLSDAVGYLYLPNNFTKNEEGLFFVQTA